MASLWTISAALSLRTAASNTSSDDEYNPTWKYQQRGEMEIVHKRVTRSATMGQPASSSSQQPNRPAFGDLTNNATRPRRAEWVKRRSQHRVRRSKSELAETGVFRTRRRSDAGPTSSSGTGPPPTTRHETGKVTQSHNSFLSTDNPPTVRPERSKSAHCSRGNRPALVPRETSQPRRWAHAQTRFDAIEEKPAEEEFETALVEGDANGAAGLEGDANGAAGLEDGFNGDAVDLDKSSGVPRRKRPSVTRCDTISGRPKTTKTYASDTSTSSDDEIEVSRATAAGPSTNARGVAVSSPDGFLSWHKTCSPLKSPDVRKIKSEMAKFAKKTKNKRNMNSVVHVDVGRKVIQVKGTALSKADAPGFFSSPGLKASIKSPRKACISPKKSILKKRGSRFSFFKKSTKQQQQQSKKANPAQKTTARDNGVAAHQTGVASSFSHAPGISGSYTNVMKAATTAINAKVDPKFIVSVDSPGTVGQNVKSSDVLMADDVDGANKTNAAGVDDAKSSKTGTFDQEVPIEGSPEFFKDKMNSVIKDCALHAAAKNRRKNSMAARCDAVFDQIDIPNFADDELEFEEEDPSKAAKVVVKKDHRPRGRYNDDLLEAKIDLRDEHVPKDITPQDVMFLPPTSTDGASSLPAFNRGNTVDKPSLGQDKLNSSFRGTGCAGGIFSCFSGRAASGVRSLQQRNKDNHQKRH